MVFYAKSPRNISLENAIFLQNIAKNLKINGVGVFVNKNINELKKIIKDIKLRFVQLHGSEDEKYIQSLNRDQIQDQHESSQSESKANLYCFTKYRKV